MVYTDGLSYLGLGEALAAQGKATEALQEYWALFYPGSSVSWGGSDIMRGHLEYALLNQAGYWSEAVSHYEAALPVDPNTSDPTALAAAISLTWG